MQLILLKVINQKQVMLPQEVFINKGVDDKIEKILGSAMDFDRPGSFDVVVVNYLLDVFDPDAMLKVYAHLVRQLKPGGMMALAGYAPLNGGAAHRLLQYLNHAYANLFCALTVRNAIHGIYDYAKYFEILGLQELAHQDFPFFGKYGPRFQRTWLAVKVKE